MPRAASPGRAEAVEPAGGIFTPPGATVAEARSPLGRNFPQAASPSVPTVACFASSHDAGQTFEGCMQERDFRGSSRHQSHAALPVPFRRAPAARKRPPVGDRFPGGGRIAQGSLGALRGKGRPVPAWCVGWQKLCAARAELPGRGSVSTLFSAHCHSIPSMSPAWCTDPSCHPGAQCPCLWCQPPVWHAASKQSRCLSFGSGHSKAPVDLSEAGSGSNPCLRSMWPFMPVLVHAHAPSQHWLVLYACNSIAMECAGMDRSASRWLTTLARWR